MSYSSRVQRQRNAHTHDERSSEAFFGKKHDEDKSQNQFFQDRLSVSEPGDAQEKEADAAANAVVNKSAAGPSVNQKNGGSVQRLSTPAEDEKLGTNDSRIKKDKDIQTKAAAGSEKEKKKKPVQKKSDPKKEKKKPVQKMDDDMENKQPEQKMDDAEKEKKKPVQTKQESGGGVASPVLSSRIEQSAGKGSSLPDKTLQEMNSAFGRDFGDVTIHDDSESTRMNKELGAQAFTHGKDIYFSEGKFDTENTSGKSLLAHELTHVVQQNGK
jgi:outer membrane biosynthesis protein TonB